MGEERGQLQALRFQADDSKKGRPKKMEKIAGVCMIPRSLQRLDVQNRERWRPGCKNRLTLLCGENLLGAKIRKIHSPGAK